MNTPAENEDNMVNQAVHDELLKKFRVHFGREPEVVAYAPGRIEVLGNHTDYNEGYVFSAAINYGTFFAAASCSTSACRLVAGDLMKEKPAAFPQDWEPGLRRPQWRPLWLP